MYTKTHTTIATYCLTFLLSLILLVAIVPVEAGEKDGGYKDSEESLLFFAGGEKNIYTVATQVTVDALLSGDLFAIAESIDVEAVVIGDLAVLGGSIEVEAPVEGDVRAVGTTVTLSDHVFGEVIIAGEHVGITKGGIVDESVVLFATEATIKGTINGDLMFYGEKLDIEGTIKGTLHAGGARRIQLQNGATVQGDIKAERVEKIILHPGSNIAGSIFYKGKNKELLTILPGATVQGETVFTKQKKGMRGDPLHLSTLLFFLVIGFLLFLPFRKKKVHALIKTTVKEYAVAVGSGIIVVLATSIGAFVLLFTFLWPISIVAFFPVLALIVAGILLSPIVVGTLLWRLYEKRAPVSWKTVLVGAIALYLLSFIHLALPLACIVGLFFLGTVALHGYRWLDEA